MTGSTVDFISVVKCSIFDAIFIFFGEGKHQYNSSYIRGYLRGRYSLIQRQIYNCQKDVRIIKRIGFLDFAQDLYPSMSEK